MGFVNREERDRYTLKPIKGIGSRQAFRGKIQQAELAFLGLESSPVIMLDDTSRTCPDAG